ncbi:hypothetical protein C8J57DRAFT_1399862 [Mycena rebaudengoi]|nr:hypothetical protein C8J57DRAFT_1399862 [Mycena rebaudengoi]
MADATPSSTPPVRDTWYYPPEIADDLKDVDLPDEIKAEILTCAFEYARCVIPCYTNWDRFLAWIRLLVMTIVVEFKGDMVDVIAGDKILGYSLSGNLSTLFEGTPGHADMAREFRAYLLFTSEKTSDRRYGELFRRYINCLVQSPTQWFRLRDCDSLARLTLAAALACNDLDDVWFSEDQFQVLAELAIILYDGVAFYKHRSEGEIHNTFGYIPDARLKAWRQCREVLWALDVAWARRKDMQIVINFIRFVGGPIHMLMRRYRFVEDGMAIGKPETEHVVAQTRANFKLWNRFDATGDSKENIRAEDIQHCRTVLARSDELLIQGLAEALKTAGDGMCGTCPYRATYGAQATSGFGGVELCAGCTIEWCTFVESLPRRAAQVFPELVDTYSRAISSVRSGVRA